MPLGETARPTIARGEFLKAFDDRRLAFLYQDKTADGKR
jgi:hypothetical protein